MRLHHHQGLHVGGDDVVIVHHCCRIDKFTHWLGLGFFSLGSLGLGIRYSLAKFKRCNGPELGCFVTKLRVRLLEALDNSSNSALLVIFAIEVDEEDEENEENDNTDTGHHC